MELSGTIITLIIIIIAYTILSLVLRRFKKLWRFISTVSAILFVVFAVLVVLIYKDSSEFAKRFSAEESVFLLNDNGKITTALYLDPSNQANVQQGMTFLSKSQIEDIADKYIQKDYDGILGSRYKIFIAEKKLFEEELSASLQIGSSSYPKQEIIDMMTKDNAFDIFSSRIFKDGGFPPGSEEQVKEKIKEQMDFDDEQDIKAFIFLYTFANTVLGADKTKSDSLSLFKQIKKGNIEIYKKTLLFRTMNFVPLEKVSQMMKAVNLS